MSTFIVIPALNEEKYLGQVLDNLKERGYNDIIVVDDGSTDKTYEVAKSRNVTALKHIINRGQGAALQTGMTYALLNNAEYIIHFDSDGQHNPDEIEKLLEPIKKGEAEACLGSRFLSKQKMPLKRKIILKGGIFLIWAMYHIKLTDVHNGFRAFSREGAKKTIMTTDKMEHASEILEKIKKNKVRYKEIPVNIIYEERHLKEGRKGQGRFDAIQILLKMIFKKIGA